MERSIFVYIENAHNISIYKPYFQYEGSSISTLIGMVKNNLQIQDKPNIKIGVYDRRFGCVSRKEVVNLENLVGTDVYIRLRVE